VKRPVKDVRQRSRGKTQRGKREIMERTGWGVDLEENSSTRRTGNFEGSEEALVSL